MATASVLQRRKEMGVRRVLGARTADILLLVGRDLGRVVLVGCALSWPVGYWVGRRWLDGYAYHADPALWGLLGATAVVLLAAAMAAGWQVAWAARVDPVVVLKRE